MILAYLILTGTAKTRAVEMNGLALEPAQANQAFAMEPALDFTWGYTGFGPMVLAYAILLEATQSPELALDFRMPFMREFTSRFKDNFYEEIDLAAWLKARLALYPFRPAYLENIPMLMEAQNV